MVKTLLAAEAAGAARTVPFGPALAGHGMTATIGKGQGRKAGSRDMPVQAAFAAELFGAAA